MILLLESFLVAIYSCAIFSILKYSLLKINILSLIFITGFFKHFIGWISGLQHMYCVSKSHENISLSRQQRYSDRHSQRQNYSQRHLFIDNFIALVVSKIIESLGEGVLFVGVFLIIHSLSLIHNNYLIVCIIGAFLHLLFDFIGIHRMFCNAQNVL
jgi:hypothetical protein